ncbi:MAG: DUF4340 domain-containing protein [Fusicatenibacter sp.]|nr:DUF4340 domain-containing protein [Fusicatenibacter sp.]
MKKKGKLIGGLILLVLLVLVLVLMTRSSGTDESDDGSTSEEDAVVSIESEEITGLAFTLDGTDVSFTKTEDTWSYDQDQQFPLNETKISSLADKVCSITAERVIEGENIGELSDYGLDDPQNILTITKEDGTKTVLRIGDENSTSGNYYLMLNEDADKIYLVSTSFDTMFPENLMDWASGESLPSISSDTIIGVQVKGENSFWLIEDTETAEWTVCDENGKEYDTEDDSVSTLTSAAASLSYSDFVAYGCTDFSPYGLEQPKATIVVRYTEEQESEETEETSESEEEGSESEVESESESEETETVTVEKELVLLVGNTNEDGSYYVTTEGSDEVHLMTASKVEAITATTVNDYWNLYIDMQNVADIEALKVIYQGETKTIERHVEEVTDEDDESSTSEEITYLCDGEELDKTTFTSFYSSVISAKAQTKDLSLLCPEEDAEFTVVFIKTDGTEFTVSYRKYDSSFYYTEDVYGIPSLVNKNSIKSMIEYYEELFGET